MKGKVTPGSRFDPSNWWDEDGFLLGLHTLLDPVRIPHFESVLSSMTDAHVLDVGCGGGFVSSSLGADGYRVVGLDISWGAITSARRNGEGGFVLGDAHDLPFAKDTFDAVICSEVLEHVDEPRRVISECARVIRPGGSFLFSTPNRTLLSRLVLIGLAQHWPPTRVLPADLHQFERFMTPAELSAALAANGMTIESIHGLTIPAREIPAAISTLYRLKRGRIGFAEAGRRIRLGLGRMSAVSYIGHAVSRKPDPS